MLGPDTDWRQGCILTDKDARSLGLVKQVNSGKRAVVISHDCDLANENEEFVEVIIGQQASCLDPLLVGARHPRRLHLKFLEPNGDLFCIELQHSHRRVIQKNQFARFKNGDQDLVLMPDEKRALKQWLAARYGRPAFPNAFEARLRKEIKRKPVEWHIAKILDLPFDHLLGLFFDLGEERFVELPDGKPYWLSISVVYDSEKGGKTAREAGETAAEKILGLFQEAYGTPDCATEIALEKCTAVADSKVTLADLRKIDQWRLEYISLRQNPVGNFLAVGEQPA